MDIAGGFQMIIFDLSPPSLHNMYALQMLIAQIWFLEVLVRHHSTFQIYADARISNMLNCLHPSLNSRSVLASPLIISADLRTIAKDHPDCLALMLNPEIVAVNQDPAGLAPFLVSQRTNGTSQTNKQTSASARTDSGIKNGIAHEKNVTTSNIISQVFARTLQGGEVAVVLLNRYS